MPRFGISSIQTDSRRQRYRRLRTPTRPEPRVVAVGQPCRDALSRRRRQFLPAVLDRINAALGLPNESIQVASLDFTIARVIDKIPRHEGPDMPDRIIVATALALQLPLVTREHKIQSTSIQTIW